MKLDILAFGAHPDDVELSCGGTIAKLVAQGKKIGIIDLTQGELGTRGTAETRKIEAENAAKILGVSVRENLNMPDGFLENSKKFQLQIIQKIRQYQPEIVLCNAIKDRHPDHAKASKLVSDACFLSGLLKIETVDLEGKNQKEHRPKQVYHYIQWLEIEPDFVIDITGFETIKMQSCLAYQTQFYNPNSTEKETPISSQNFQESILYRNKNWGRLSGVDFAEGFTSEKLLCVEGFEFK